MTQKIINFLKSKEAIGSIIFLAVLFIITIFAILTFLQGSFGWFSNNKRVNATGMQVTVAEPDYIYIESYEIYKMSDDINGTITKVSDNLNPQTVSLNTYDYVLREKNYATRLIIKIVITSIPSSKNGIKVTMSTSSGILDGEDNWLRVASNICSVRAKFGDSSDAIDDVFDDFEADTTTPYNSFLTVEHGGDPEPHNVKVATKDINVTNLDDYDYTVGNARKVAMYLEITYNDDLVDEFNEQNRNVLESLEVFEDNIDFTYDFNAFVLDFLS